MKSTYWINMGLDMALVDERGVILGILHPLDEQIGAKIKRASYGDRRQFERDRLEREVRAG